MLLLCCATHSARFSGRSGNGCWNCVRRPESPPRSSWDIYRRAIVPTSDDSRLGETGVTLDTLAAVLAPMSITLAQFFRPFDLTHRPRTPRRRE